MVSFVAFLDGVMMMLQDLPMWSRSWVRLPEIEAKICGGRLSGLWGQPLE